MTTQETKTAIEAAPQAIDHIISELGLEKESNTAKAIEKAATDQEGGSLTKSEIAELQGLNDSELIKIYENMDETQKSVFGS
jgi:hypothetical protein